MKLAALLPALTLLACHGDDATTDAGTGDDSDVQVAIAGVYRVTSDQSSDDCGTFEDVVLPVPFYEVVGVPGGVEVRACRSETDCNDYADDGLELEPADAGYKSLITWSHYQEDDGSCILDARRTTLKVKAGGAIALESTQVEIATTPTGQGSTAACVRAEQDWTPSFQSDTLNCWKREATPIGG